jgi:hypothetical protein
MLFFKAIVVWLVFIAAESLNGIFRELFLVPRLGELSAHQLGFVTGSALILAIATIFASWLGAYRQPQLLKIGSLWLILTVLFEIALGRLVLGYAWERIFADYNLISGRLMLLGLVLLVLAPLIAVKLRGLSGAENS